MARQRVENVNDGTDLRRRVDLVVLDSNGIASAVGTLMVLVNHHQLPPAQIESPRELFKAVVRVPSDDCGLFGRQCAGLVQDGLGDLAFANVMQQGARGKRRHALRSAMPTAAARAVQ